MEKVRLGDIELTATQVLRLSLRATTPRHKTEKQFSVADHIIEEPEALRVSCKLFKDSSEYEELLKLYNSKQPVRFTSELYDIEEVVVEEFEVSPAGLNTYDAEITVKAIRRAELKTRIVTFEDPATGVKQDTGNEPPGGDTAVTPKQINHQNKPKKEENKSWLESLISWVGGLFA